MLGDEQKRSGDRRGGYSPRKHLARLTKEGRLPRIGLGALAVLIVGGVTFARCQSSSITGPSSQMAKSSGAPSLHESSGGSMLPDDASTFKERTVQYNLVFTGYNPCNDDAIIAEGTRYENIRVTAGTGYFDSHNRVKDYFKGFAVNDPPPRPTKYKGENEFEHDMRITALNGVDEEREVEQELIAIGPEPDFRLKIYARYRVRPSSNILDAATPEVTYRARATCEVTKCRKSGGCGDRDCRTEKQEVVEIPSMPTVAPE